MENRTWPGVLRKFAEKPVIGAVFLVVVTVGAYWPVLHCGFVYYDDPEYVTANPHILNGLSWHGITWALGTYHASNWHPLTWLSHMTDVSLFGNGPTGPHVINALFHAANAFLLLLLLLRTTRAYWRSLFVAALFALHPLHVESVAWVSERKDVLSAFFGILTLLAYCRYVQLREAKSGVRSVRFYYLLAVSLLALGLMSKPMLVTWPCLLLLLDFWPLGRFGPVAQNSRLSSVWPLIREKLPFLLLAAIVSVATLRAQRGAMQPLDNLPFDLRLENAFVSYLRYFGKMLWPEGLVVLYPYPGEWPLWVVVLAVAVTAAVSSGAWVWREAIPYLFTGWFWFVGTLVPVIGLVQVGSQSIADRYSYLPLVGIFIVLSWGGAATARRLSMPNALVGILAALGLAVCAVSTWRQAIYWTDNESLSRHAIDVTPRNYVALSSLGVSLFHKGRFEEAIEYYHKALEINPNYVDAMSNIGVALSAKGSDEALGWFYKALRASPGNGAVLYDLANELARRGQFSESVSCLQEVLRSKPDHYQALNNLGNALMELDRINDAIGCYQSALTLAPDDAQIQKNLAMALLKQGKSGDAVPIFLHALKTAPDDAAVHYGLGLAFSLQDKWVDATYYYRTAAGLAPTNAEVQYNLGYALRVQNQIDDAISHFEEALRLKPEFPVAHYNLACALADKGRGPEAVAHLIEAVRLNPNYEEAKTKLSSLTNRLGRKR